MKKDRGKGYKEFPA